MKPAIKQFPDNIAGEKRTIAIQIRELIYKLGPTITEAIN